MNLIESSIFRAIKEDDFDPLVELVSMAGNLDFFDDKGNTPLTFSTMQLHAEAVDLLLQFGADPRASNKGGQTALDILSEYIDKEKAKTANRNNSPSTSPSMNGVYWQIEVEKILDLLIAKLEDPAEIEQALRLCVENNFPGSLEKLLKLRIDPNSKLGKGRFLLMTAVLEGHTAIADVLVKNGANPKETDKLGYSLLHLATSKDKIGVAGVLIRAGADIHANNMKGESPLDIAQKNDFKEISFLMRNFKKKSRGIPGPNELNFNKILCECDLELVKFFVECGGNPLEVNKDGRPPIISLLSNTSSNPQWKEITDYLLSLDQSRGIQNCHGVGALRMAVADDRIELVDYLISRKIGVNSKPLPGEGTLLELAVKADFRRLDPRCIYTLIKQGAKINVKDESGGNLLHQLILKYVDREKGKFEIVYQRIVDLLVAHGLDIHHVDSLGRNALHLAADLNIVWLARMLINNDVAFNVPDNYDHTAYALVRGGRRPKIEKLILNKLIGKREEIA